MSKMTDRLVLDFIKRQYHPYDTHGEFTRGFAAFQDGNCRNPNEADSVPGRAWDCGVAAAMRYSKAVAA
ncbi:MAG: hypothetical protein JNM23_02580 [Bradyrhizobiaceae bacterium]|nr:hypothetical protein [Bradyrhizobiaceae bacterium]